MDGHHEGFMAVALAEAECAAAAGEVPVGAVVVIDGTIVAQSHNRVEELGDPTAHAELLAIHAATRGGHDLKRATLYVTLEPCIMCAGAIVLSRIRTLVYGADDAKAGAVRSLYTAVTDSRLNHRCNVVHGVCADRSALLLKGFFEKLRKPAGRS